jgi:hypothetical protein
MVFSLIQFFIIIILTDICIKGYCILFFKKKFSTCKISNNFISFIYIIIILNLIGYILYLIPIRSSIIPFFIFIVGIGLFIKNFSKIFYVEKIHYIFLITLLSNVLISKNHEDFLPNHLPYIYHIVNDGLVLGISNLELSYTYSSFFSYFQYLFYNDIHKYNLFYIPIFIILINVISFLFNIILNKNKLSILATIFCSFIIIKYARISSFGYDFLATLLMVSTLFINYLNHKNRNDNNLILFNIIIFIYALSIKLTSIFFLPIIIFFILIDIKKFFKYKKIEVVLFLSLVTFYFLEIFLKTGCLAYYIPESCINKNIIPWAIDKNKIINFSQHVELWAKGYYHQDIYSDKNEYLNIKNWIPNWFKIHFFYKVSEFLLLFLLINIISLILTSKEKKEKISKKKNNRINLFFFSTSLISIVFWLFFLPQLRFGDSVVLAMFFVINLFIIKYFRIINLNNYVILIVISILINNFKNFTRINDELHASDINYQFKNFPYPARIEEYHKIYIRDKKEIFTKDFFSIKYYSSN